MSKKQVDDVKYDYDRAVEEYEKLMKGDDTHHIRQQLHEVEQSLRRVQGDYDADDSVRRLLSEHRDHFERLRLEATQLDQQRARLAIQMQELCNKYTRDSTDDVAAILPRDVTQLETSRAAMEEKRFRLYVPLVV